jgi:hypothetical protein
MIFLAIIVALLMSLFMWALKVRKARDQSLQQFAEFCDNFNNKLKLFAGFAAVQVLLKKYGETRLTQRIRAFKNETELTSFPREEALKKVMQRVETETDPEKKSLFLALFYSTTTRWANDLGLTEEIVKIHLNHFADQLGFSKESARSTQRN